MKLALFFSRGISLKTWVDTGLFDREKAVYARLLASPEIERVFWVTYGTEDAALASALQQSGALPEGILVLPMPSVFASRIGHILYSFLAPFWHWKSLRDVSVVKSNQMDGAWAPLLAKGLLRKRFFARTGYTASLFRKRECGEKSVQYVFYRLVETIVYFFADASAVSSQADLGYIAGNYGAKNAVCLPNYVDDTRFTPEQTSDNRFVFVGRLNVQKNLRALIGAVAELGVGLDMYGEGELRCELETLAKNVGADVVFHGAVPQGALARRLNSTRYFVLPSLYEGMPKALLEAMGSGCVCVATPVAGSSEIIQDGVNGFLAESTAQPSIADALGRALALTDCERADVARKARETILNTFSLRAVVDNELKLLKRLQLGIALESPPHVAPGTSSATPQVSILLSVHNGLPYLSEAVESALRQTVTDFEFIITDDGSTDGTGELLKQFQKADSRIRVVSLAQNVGLTAALNIGLYYARAPYIARLDADDLWLPEKLERQLPLLRDNPQMVLVGTAYDCIDSKGLPFGGQDVVLRCSPEEIHQSVGQFNPFFHGSVVFRRHAALAVGGYDKRVKAAQDYDLWLALLRKGQGQNLCDKLARRRVHEKMISQTKARKQRMYAMLARMKNPWCLQQAETWKGLAKDLAVVVLPQKLISYCRNKRATNR